MLLDTPAESLSSAPSDIGLGSSFHPGFGCSASWHLQPMGVVVISAADMVTHVSGVHDAVSRRRVRITQHRQREDFMQAVPNCIGRRRGSPTQTAFFNL